jgi:hypothetical protein
MSAIIFAGQPFLELLTHEFGSRGVQYRFRHLKYSISFVSWPPKDFVYLFTLFQFTEMGQNLMTTRSDAAGGRSCHIN